MTNLYSTLLDLKDSSLNSILLPGTCSELDQRIVVMDKQECIFLKVSNICYIQGNGAYSILNLQNGKSLIVSKNIKTFSEKLSEKIFFRIHKSYMVNLYYVSKYVKSDGGYLMMENGTTIPVSPNKRDLIIDLVTKLSL